MKLRSCLLGVLCVLGLLFFVLTARRHHLTLSVSKAAADGFMSDIARDLRYSYNERKRKPMRAITLPPLVTLKPVRELLPHLIETSNQMKHHPEAKADSHHNPGVKSDSPAAGGAGAAAFVPYDPDPSVSPPNSLIFAGREVGCRDLARVSRDTFIAQGATKMAYAARFGSHHVVLKLPRPDDPYNLTRRAMARVFWKEATMLLELAGPHVIKYYGGCFREDRTFNVVEGLRQLSKVTTEETAESGVVGAVVGFAERVDMAIGVSELIQEWNRKDTIYCDFMPQQFGVDGTLVVKALDVEGLVKLKQDGSQVHRLFSERKCSTDAQCMNSGCYKAPRLWGGGQSEMIDEIRCDTSIGHCIGMGTEYNVYALCRMLLVPILENGNTVPQSARDQVKELLNGCRAIRLDERLSIDEVLNRLKALKID